jgi:hypothetical protein
MPDREIEPQPPAQITDRVVASFNTYAGMIDAMRNRAVERRIAITSPEVAMMANLPEAYIAKLLSVHPIRRIGMISLGPLLSVLGVKLLMVEDRETIERMNRLAIYKFGKPLQPRNEGCVHNGAAIAFKFSRAYMQKIGKKGAQVRWKAERKIRAAAVKGGTNSRKNMTPRQASELARKAILARWAKVAAKKAASEAHALARKAAKAAA